MSAVMNDTMSSPLLDVRNLTLKFPRVYGNVEVVQDVNFTVFRGEAVGLVGESGCGKSLSCYAITRLLPPGCVVSGSVVFDGRELLGLSDKQMRQVRGREITMVYQDPMTSLNPVMKVRTQVAEAVSRRPPDDGQESRPERVSVFQRVCHLLDLMGLPTPPQYARRYPFELSGGMRQRVLMAMAIAPSPKLLIADEPTTALDVTIQAQILELLKQLQRERHFAVLYVTHDLGIVREFCQRVVVMYAGQMVEAGPTEEIFTRPYHPYARGLLEAAYSRETAGGRLQTIAGTVASPKDFPVGCRFYDRCYQRGEECRQPLPLVEVTPGHIVRCHRLDLHAEDLL